MHFEMDWMSARSGEDSQEREKPTAIKAVVRVAPDAQLDKTSGSRRSNQHTIPCSIDDKNHSISVHQECHKFDQVLQTADTNNLTIYENACQDLVDDVLHGVNCAAFTWGTPQTGKTYTFYGCEQEFGVIHFTVERVYEQIQKIRAEKPHAQFSVQLSAVDICPSGKVIDLLDLGSESLAPVDLHSETPVLDQVTKIGCFFASHAHEFVANAEEKERPEGALAFVV